MKRTLAILAVAVVVLGGGTAAFAAAGGAKVDPQTRAAAKECIQKARADHPGDRPAIRAAVKTCLEQAGVDVGKLGHPLKAVRDQVKALPADKKAALKACVKAARTDHQGDRPAAKEAVKACLTQAGITLPAPAAAPAS